MADIELVVKINEKDYQSLKDGHIPFNMLDVIKNGTPLPKGHGDLKDADALAIHIAMLRDKCNYYGNEYESACFQTYDNAVDEIIDAPTIIDADKECDEE